MLFQVYGANAPYQWLGWILVFACLIGLNEVARRSKTGGIICFLAIPGALTVYFLAIYISAAFGADWALHNPTYVHMTSWFHYAKLYAATAGCIGFMALKYGWGKIGKSHWFKLPFHHRRDQHPDRRGLRLRIRLARMGRNLGVH